MRFILGLLLGAAAGAAVGLIIAPRPGRETREAIQRRIHPVMEEEDGEAEEEARIVRASQA